MKKVLLKHEGRGVLRAVTEPDRKTVEEIPTGCTTWFELTTPKSIQQNRFIHAAIETAWLNQRQERWSSVEHLKSAAFCAVGYCQIIEIDPEIVGETSKFVELVACLFDTLGGRGFFPILFEVEGRLEIRLPRRWSECPQDERSELVQKVLDWCCSEEGPCPGADPSQFFQTAAAS